MCVAVKIRSLEYKNLISGWELAHADFSAFSLLVGASGVGKTRILQSFRTLGDMALGKSVESNAVRWNMEFEVEDYRYSWFGQTSTKSSKYSTEGEISQVSKNNSEYTKETLIRFDKDGKTTEIFNRDDSEVTFMRDKLPKITSGKSCIDTFAEEDAIKPVQEGFKRVNFFDFEQERRYIPRELEVVDSDDNDFDFDDDDMETLKELSAPAIIKLSILYQVRRAMFDEIKQEFLEIFEYVEDMRFNKTSKDSDGDFILELQIKEFDSDWISHRVMSSGMLKTLLFLTMNHLVPRGSVILIDEFENSLGINCIDLLTVGEAELNGIQYLVTSHHPYIINNVPMNRWKIVTRSQGKTIVKDASEYSLGNSKHVAFKQLINLSAYIEGRE